MSAELMIRVRANADEAKAAFAQTTDGLRRIQRETNGVSRGMQAAQINTGNLAAQFNDIGVMMAAGQNPLQLALQQGTQISQVLGPMGAAGAVKALGGAFLAMLNPISLVTIAVIAGGAALFQWATSAKEGADEAADAYDRLLDSVKDYRAAQDAMDPRRMADAYGVMADRARDVLEIQRSLAQAEARRAIMAAGESAASVMGNFVGLRSGEAAGNIAALRQLQVEQAAIFAQMDAATDSATLNILNAQSIAKQAEIDTYKWVSDALATIEQSFGLATDEAERAASMFERMANADTVEEQASAAEELAEYLFVASDNMQSADDNGFEFLQRLNDIITKGFEFANLNMSDAVDEATRSTDFLVNRLDAAISRGEDFAALLDRLNGAVDRAANADNYQAEFAARAGTAQGANDQALVSAVAAAAARTGQRRRARAMIRR